MSLADLAKQQVTNPNECSVCALERTVKDDKSEYDGLQSVLSNPAWTYEMLTEALNADEHTKVTITTRALERHVKGACKGRRGQGHLRKASL